MSELEATRSANEETRSTEATDPAVHVRRAIKQRYPELTDAEVESAAANLIRYFEVVLSIAEDTSDAPSTLTAPDSVSTMNERSKNNSRY